MESHFPIPSGHQSALARERVMDDLRNLANDAELLLKATAGDVSDKARDARLRLTAAINQARSTVTELGRRGAKAAGVAVKRADTVVRDHPYETILTALAVGLLAGFVLAGKMSDGEA